MKTIIISLVALMLVVVPFTTAAESPKLELDKVQLKLNSLWVKNLDETGDDTFQVKRGDTYALDFDFTNDGNKSIEIRLEGDVESIDLGDDIEEIQDYFTITSDNNKKKLLSFGTVKTNTPLGTYDMTVIIKYKYDGGSGTYATLDYEVEVVSDYGVEQSGTSSGTTPSSVTTSIITSAINNMSKSCDNIAQSTTTCFGYVTKSSECSGELSTVKEERGTYKQQADDYRARLDTCTSEKNNMEQKVAVAETEVETMRNTMLTNSECDALKTAAVTENQSKADSKFNQTLGLVAIGAAGFWFWNNRKKAKASVASSYDYDYVGRG